MIGLVSVLLFLCEEQNGDSGETCSSGQQSQAESGGLEDRLHEFLEKIMNSQLYGKVMHSELMDKYADLYDKVIHSDIVNKVMHSRMIVDPKALAIQVLHELKALQGELKESLLLHVERRSLVVAGVLVAVAAALLLLGCVWINWCHEEHGEYRYIPASQVEEFLRYQSIPGAPSPSKEGAHVSRPHRRHRRSRHKGGQAGKEGVPVSSTDGLEKVPLLETGPSAGSETESCDKVLQDPSADVGGTPLEAQRSGAEEVCGCLAQPEDSASTAQSCETDNAAEDAGVVDKAVVVGGDQDGFVMTHRKHHRQLSNGCSGGKY